MSREIGKPLPVSIIIGESFGSPSNSPYARRRVEAVEAVNEMVANGKLVVGHDPGYEPTEATQLAETDWHITIAGCHCGDAACTRCDPMERYVDGLTVRECLERFSQRQRMFDVCGPPMRNGLPFIAQEGCPWHLTAAQLEAARTAWSAALRAKTKEAEDKERRRIVCDDDRWEVE